MGENILAAANCADAKLERKMGSDEIMVVWTYFLKFCEEAWGLIWT